MTRTKLPILTLLFFLLNSLASLAAAPEVCILGRRTAQDAVIVLPANASTILRYAVSDFNEDCRESASRELPVVTTLGEAGPRPVILPAVIGKSPLLDRLIAEKRIDIDSIRGQWESFAIIPVSQPFTDCPAIPGALIIAGSDDRGAMYGLYEVSERLLGTDPQKFWTDAVPHRVRNSVWNQGRIVQGPPTFKFRGWFVNDEHALLGWHHREGEDNSIKPEDWAEIFETICRMRGNFYTLIEYGQTPDSASLRLANDRGLYVTGSHMHMLITNTSYAFDPGPHTWTWDAFCEKVYGKRYPYSWITQREKILRFWEEEGVKRHKDHLAIWTVGLKGANDTDFHENDSTAPRSVVERARLTNEAIRIQTEIVERNLPGTEPLYMIANRNDLFDQYLTGELQFPENTCILWPDDPSFGVFRLLPEEKHLAKDPLHGIFFHLTFCDNHWVQWYPMSGVQHELVKAVRAGAVSMAEFNVGDIREIPLKTAMAMDLAYDARPWMTDTEHRRMDRPSIRHAQPVASDRSPRPLLGPRDARAVDDHSRAHVAVHDSRRSDTQKDRRRDRQAPSDGRIRPFDRGADGRPLRQNGPGGTLAQCSRVGTIVERGQCPHSGDPFRPTPFLLRFRSAANRHFAADEPLGRRTVAGLRRHRRRAFRRSRRPSGESQRLRERAGRMSRPRRARQMERLVRRRPALPVDQSHVGFPL